MPWTLEQKLAWFKPGYAHTMVNLSKRLIVRIEGEDIVYEKIGGEGVRHYGADTYGRCRVAAFWNQMRYPPDQSRLVCPVIPLVSLHLMFLTQRQQKHA